MSLHIGKSIHPLLAYTLAFSMGIIAKFFQIQIIFIVFLIVFSIGITLALYFKQKKFQTNIIFHVVFFSLGFLRFNLWEKQHQKISDILKTSSNYTAKVLDICDYAHPFFKYKVLLNIAPNDINKQSMSFKINIYMPNLFGIRISDHLEILNLKTSSCKNDLKSLYSNSSLIPKVFTSKLLFSTIKRPQLSLSRLLQETKYKLACILRAKMSKASSTLFEYIFLGLKNSTNLSEEFRYKFNQWGIAHYLARSGLHVVMIIFLWSLFLKTIPLGFIYKQLILIFLSLIYSIFSWSSTSFERAFISFLLVQICLILKLPFRSSYLVTLCTLSFLILSPIQLFLLDFQLSFGLALGIAIFHELQNKKH